MRAIAVTTDACLVIVQWFVGRNALELLTKISECLQRSDDGMVADLTKQAIDTGKNLVGAS